jgi:hypothetical protein
MSYDYERSDDVDDGGGRPPRGGVGAALGRRDSTRAPSRPAAAAIYYIAYRQKNKCRKRVNGNTDTQYVYIMRRGVGCRGPGRAAVAVSRVGGDRHRDRAVGPSRDSLDTAHASAAAPQPLRSRLHRFTPHARPQTPVATRGTSLSNSILNAPHEARATCLV